MALRANALVTVSECKTQLDIPTLDTSQDAFLERLINSASEQIERHCNRKFKSVEASEIFDGSRSNELLLPRVPATSVAEVYVDSARTFGADTKLEATSYALIGQVLRKHLGTWGSGSQVIKVKYTAGFSTIPADVEDACILLVEYRYRLKNDRRLGRTSQGKQGESISFTADWPLEAISLLEPYVLLPFVSDSMAVLV